jgi:hypothetical protein
MKTLKKFTIKELEQTMICIGEAEIGNYLGGTNGDSLGSYTEEDFCNLMDNGTWQGGYVQGWGYVSPEVIVIAASYNPSSLRKTGIDSYDIMYKGGFDVGWDAGYSPTKLDDVAAYMWALVAAGTAGSDFGDVNYDMIHYSEGIKDGIRAGKKAQPNY